MAIEVFEIIQVAPIVQLVENDDAPIRVSVERVMHKVGADKAGAAGHEQISHNNTSMKDSLDRGLIPAQMAPRYSSARGCRETCGIQFAATHHKQATIDLVYNHIFQCAEFIERSADL